MTKSDPKHLPRASPVGGAIHNHILYLGPRDSSHCVHQQLILLGNHLTVRVHQLYVCVQDKDVGAKTGPWSFNSSINFQPEPGPYPETCAVDVLLG